MALDHGYHFAAPTLPTPTDTPYDIQSLERSSSPSSEYSSMLVPPIEDSYFPKPGTIDDGNTDRMSAHESRRFTPNNLGISLVAQIHSLRKELGCKNSTIENLEENMHKSRAENEQLTQDLKTQKAEVTAVKKQMQSLENDTLQGLEVVAKERDRAIESIADTRKRLEDSKKKVRAQEEDAEKVHVLWENDRQDWEDNRRKLEGRVHVVEERLKTMVAEMLIVQNTDQETSGMVDVDDGIRDTSFGQGYVTSSIRATSRLSNRSLDDSYENYGTSNFRTSKMNGLHGLSLAEELELDQGDAATDGEDSDQDALTQRDYPSTREYSEHKMASKVIGAHADTIEEPVGDENSGQHSIGIINDYMEYPVKQLVACYTDTGTQFSPPSSPVQQTSEPGGLEKRIEQTERAANQSRKRIAIPQIFVEQTPAPPAPKSVEPKTLSLVSPGKQTSGRSEDLASTAEAANETSVSVPSRAIDTKSASTQTTEDPTGASSPANSRLSRSHMDVPVIAIHPPASRPSSSRSSVMLPPRTKNAACQVVIELPRNTKSTSMQTEETRIGERPVRIPIRLPSSDLSIQPRPRLAERRKKAGNISGAEPKDDLRSPPATRAEGKQPSATTARIKNAYPGNNDNGPLNPRHCSGPRRPIRFESISAGFDSSSEDDPENTQDPFSDDEFLNAAPIRKTLSKVQNSWKLVPHLKDSVSERLESASEELEDEKQVRAPKVAHAKEKDSSQTTSKTFQIRPAESHQIASSSGKQPDIRRKALISNGIVEHAQRGRSPGEANVLGNEATIAPPFPVPTRSSSRLVPFRASDGAISPSPQTTTFSNARPGQNHARPPKKRKILRKVQSAAAVTQPPFLPRSQPTHSLSASSTIPPSPKSPTPRRNQFILPYDTVANLPSHRRNVSGMGDTFAPPRTPAGEAPAETPGEQTSVVDAIAQTMVGEWMWKYIRKRTSFGLTENPQAEFDMGRNGDNGNGSGVRHKRWVWLAPFERAVIWSSKQPTSGPALLGKSGRKLTIQSVLDVKDDTPQPKNAGSQAIFDRSILILTPQRALKFTATSRERHYIWLAALAYLSHSTRGMDDLAIAPPLPRQEYQHSSSQEPMTGSHRTPLRDSVSAAIVTGRPSIGGHSYSSPIGLIEQEIIEGAKFPWEDEEAESDGAAEPPQVHRVAAHARKRSSTGPRPVPLSAFHIHPTNAMAVASSRSLQGPTSRDKYDRYTPQPQVGSGSDAMHSILTHSISEKRLAPSPVVPDNFFDTAGTVRMEAFVNGKERECVITPRGKSYRTRQGRKKDMSFWGFDASVARSGMGNARLKMEDPFTGF